MTVEPEFDERIWVGRFEVIAAERDKCFLRGDLRIGDESMDGFLAENVGLMLFPAAERVGNGREDEADAGEDQYQDCEGGPIVGGADGPAGLEAANEPADREIGQPEQDNQHQRGEGESFIDVVQDVVAGFVADDEENLIRGELVDGVVPDDDARGRADAGDVGVHVGDFFAGLHQEHARGGNVEPGVLGQLLATGW